MRLTVIVAAAENGVIGRDNDLPWRLSADLQRFKKLTMGHHLVMGRRTYESIGRPLPGRTTVVLTSQADYEPDNAVSDSAVTGTARAVTASSLEEAMKLAIDAGDTDVFVVGGAAVYAEALRMADRLELTRVLATVEGDVSLPAIDWTQWSLTDREEHPADDRNALPFAFETYERVRAIA